VIFHTPSILIRLWKSIHTSDGIEARSQTICTEATSPTCVTETIRPTTLPLGSVGYENKTDEQGQRLICWTGRWSTGCARCGAGGELFRRNSEVGEGGVVAAQLLATFGGREPWRIG
jgi:hypothetical protein